MTEDTCCTIAPYFKIHEGKLDEFKKFCEAFIEATRSEANCLYYGFSFDGDEAHCREGYKDAEALLVHLGNVGSLIEQSLKIAEITRLEVHGLESELAKLREPLQQFNPRYFTLEYGIRKGD